MTRPSLLIANPAASRLADLSRRSALLQVAASALAARTGLAPEIVIASDPATLVAAVRAARSAGTPIVAAIGGDGTLRVVAHELLGSGIPFGIVPAGTGNLLASALGLPRSAELAAALLARLPPRTIDVGQVDEPAGLEAGGTMLVACGTGFDAAVMAATSAADKRRYGVLAYFGTAARLAFALRPLEFRIRVDGVGVAATGLAALIANCGQLVPRLAAPRIPIDPTDGLLELLVVRGGGMLSGALAGLELLTLRAPHAAAMRGGRSLRIRGRRIEIETAPAAAVQVDGNAFPPSRLVVEVRPGALTVLAPDSRLP